jgi:hypothetical protein
MFSQLIALDFECVKRQSSDRWKFSKPYKPDWIRVSECPFSKAHVYRLIRSGLLKSALFDALGLGRGVRLINRRSLEELIEQAAGQSAEAVK